MPATILAPPLDAQPMETSPLSDDALSQSKGLINDPYLDETFRIHEGLRIARDLLLRVQQLGVPAGSEFLDTISPQ